MPRNKLNVNLQNWFEEDTRLDMKIYTKKQREPIYLFDVLADINVSEGWLIVESRDQKRTSYFDHEDVLYFDILSVDNGITWEPAGD